LDASFGAKLAGPRHNGEILRDFVDVVVRVKDLKPVEGLPQTYDISRGCVNPCVVWAFNEVVHSVSPSDELHIEFLATQVHGITGPVVGHGTDRNIDAGANRDLVETVAGYLRVDCVVDVVELLCHVELESCARLQVVDAESSLCDVIVENAFLGFVAVGAV